MIARPTPGPWAIDPETHSDKGEATIYSKYSGGDCDDFNAVARVPNFHGKETRDATARLIAAAPDMLYLLELARAWFDSDIDNFEKDPPTLKRLEVRLDIIRSALKCAKGA